MQEECEVTQHSVHSKGKGYNNNTVIFQMSQFNKFMHIAILLNIFNLYIYIMTKIQKKDNL